MIIFRAFVLFGAALTALPAPGAPKVGLVLTGGGARGIAQIGVLKVLESRHVPISAIVGSSMGSIIGGLYATGYSPDELDSIMRAIDWGDVLAFSDESRRSDLSLGQKLESDRSILTLRLDGFTPVPPRAFATGQRLGELINRLVWEGLDHPVRTFDDLRVRFRAVATDLNSGRRVVLSKGDLGEALRASATVPLRFVPVSRDSMMLVDGGILDNIPADVARDLGCDVVIVVNTTSPLRESSDLTTPWNVADQVVTIMMGEQYGRAFGMADLTITPELAPYTAADFGAADSIVARGVAAGERAVDSLVAILRRAGISLTEVPASTGEFARIGGITIDGPELHLADQLGASLVPHVGSRATTERFADASRDLVRELRRRGFAMARVTIRGFDPASAMLRLRVDEGRVRSVKLRGNRHTRAHVILREFPLMPGDLFRADAAIDGIARISALQLFDQVMIGVEPADTGVDLTIRVEEKPPGVLRLSGLIDDERNTQLGVEVAGDNLFGEDIHAGALIFGGVRNRISELSLRSHRLLGTDLTFGARLYSDFRDVRTYGDRSDPNQAFIKTARTGEYREIHEGGAVELSELARGLGALTLSLRYETQAALDVGGTLADGRRERLFAGRVEMAVDSRDEAPMPRRGALLNAYFESAQKAFGGFFSYSKVSFDYEGYFSLDRSGVISPRVELGLADRGMPLLENFRMGGQHSFAGFFADQLAGDQLFIASLAYRHLLPIRLYFDTYASARYDLGYVWPDPETIQFGSLRHGLLFSLALTTPIGLCEFSIGKSLVLANPATGQHLLRYGPTVFYFTIGAGL